MKTIIKILFYATLLAIPCLGFTQHTPWNGEIDANGVYLGHIYTKSHVIAKWSTPTKYRSNTSEFGLNETYHYSSNLFRFSDNGIFNSFYIKTADFVVYKSKNGGFKVGDPLSRLLSIGLISQLPKDFGNSVEKTLTLNGGDDWFEVGYKDGVITWISYTASI